MIFKDYIKEHLLFEKIIKIGGKEFSSSKEAGLYLGSIGKSTQEIMKMLGTTEPMAAYYARASAKTKGSTSKASDLPAAVKTKETKKAEPVIQPAKKAEPKAAKGSYDHLTREERVEQIRAAIKAYKSAESKADSKMDRMSSNFFGSAFDDNGGPTTKAKMAVWEEDPEFKAARKKADTLRDKLNTILKGMGASWDGEYINWEVDTKSFPQERTTKTPEEIKKQKFAEKTIDYANDSNIAYIMKNDKYLFPDRAGSFSVPDGDGYRKDINGILIAADPSSGYIIFIDIKTKKIRSKKFSQQFAKQLTTHYNAKKNAGNLAKNVINAGNHKLVTGSRDSIALNDKDVKPVFK